jgi:hypothetical protein
LSLPGLERGAKLCYLVMCAYGRDSGRCFMSKRTLAGDLRCSTRQIKRWWRSLERAGFIRPEWRAGRPTHFSFLAHPIFEQAVKPTWDIHVPPPGTSLSPTGDTGVPQGRGSIYRTEGSSSMTTKLAGEVKAEIWGYFQGERSHQVDPPDRSIVRQCVEALHGHSIEELRVLLRDRFRRGFRPGTARGPREYTWFPPVIDNAFRPRK